MTRLAGVHRVPIEFLHECFDCDSVAGTLIWRRRPEHHFAKEWACRKFNTQFAGKPVRGEMSKGYLLVRFNIAGKKTRLRVHRVIWVMHHGEWPEAEIDHVNRNPWDNRIANLRLATRHIQGQNGVHPTGVTNLTGAYRSGAKAERYYSRIKINGKDRALGSFATPEEAAEAYAVAKAKYHV